MDKWTPEDWAQGVKLFRVYGYDPYNSWDDIEYWHTVGEKAQWS